MQKRTPGCALYVSDTAPLKTQPIAPAVLHGRVDASRILVVREVERRAVLPPRNVATRGEMVEEAWDVMQVECKCDTSPKRGGRKGLGRNSWHAPWKVLAQELRRCGASFGVAGSEGAAAAGAPHMGGVCMGWLPTVATREERRS